VWILGFGGGFRSYRDGAVDWFVSVFRRRLFVIDLPLPANPSPMLVLLVTSSPLCDFSLGHIAPAEGILFFNKLVTIRPAVVGLIEELSLFC
jgi:hypothetical protein